MYLLNTLKVAYTQTVEFLRKSKFSNNVVWTSFGLGIRLCVQTTYFIILARTLGVTEFGIFAGVLGLVTSLTPFSNWGSGLILIKKVSREPEKFPEYWGTTLTMALFVGIVFILLSMVLGELLFSTLITIQVVLPIAIGDLLGLNLTGISAQAFHAFQKLRFTSLIWIILSVSRLIAALFFLYFLVDKTVFLWSVLYMFSGLLAGITSLLLVWRNLGWGNLGLGGMKREWWNGFYFSVSNSAAGVYNDIDKTLLSRLASESIAGMYAAAYRILDAVFIPVRAIVWTSFPRFFQVGKNGISDSWAYAKRLIPLTFMISLLAWFCIAVISPIIPNILGEDYSLTPQIVIWLGPILLFRSVHSILADALSGADHQGLRSIIQIFIAFFNLLLNLWWIPLFGWLGAVWSSLLSDGGLMLLLMLLIVKLRQRQP